MKTSDMTHALSSFFCINFFILFYLLLLLFIFYPNCFQLFRLRFPSLLNNSMKDRTILKL